MASAVECFFRGIPEVVRLYFVKQGLLKFLVRELLREGFVEISTMQYMFDLLGEVIKCSPWIMRELNLILTDQQFAAIIKLLRTNTVASNQFLRVLIITAEDATVRAKLKALGVRCRFCEYLQIAENRVCVW